MFFIYLDNTDDFRWKTENDMDTENDFEKKQQNQFNIKCSLLNKTLHFVKTEIFSIKL